MEFFKSTNTYSKRPPKGADLWIRNSVNKKTGAKVKYLAVSRQIAESGPIQLKGMAPNFSITLAMSVPDRVVVFNVDDKRVDPDAVLKFKGRGKTAFYKNDAPLVDAMIKSMLLDTSADNHYFKLTREGNYDNCPRYLLTQIK